MGNYASYLRSTHWKARRATYLKVHRWCEFCGRRATQVHHTFYGRLGKERDQDLCAICQPCHATEHPDKDMAPPILTEIPCRSCGAEHHVEVTTLRERRYLRCIRCGDTWTEARPRMRRRGRRRHKRRDPGMRPWQECRWCGGTWPREKHESLCVRAGVDT